MSSQNLQRGQRVSIGQDFEKIFSSIIHSKKTPLAVSFLCLREIGAGQIDCSALLPCGIYLYELKSSRGKLSKKQRDRLELSRRYLSFLFMKTAYFEVKTPGCLPKWQGADNLF